MFYKVDENYILSDIVYLLEEEAQSDKWLYRIHYYLDGALDGYVNSALFSTRDAMQRDLKYMLDNPVGKDE